MNREIKYRAKRKDNGEWVYGAYFCLHHNDGRDHIHHFIIPDNTPIPKDKTIGEIQVEIIPETLGEYFGMTDKNKKEIYEGDIIKKDIFSYTICFGECSPEMFKSWCEEYFPEGLSHKLLTLYAKDIETGNIYLLEDNHLMTIIGNIHDNPELAGGK